MITNHLTTLEQSKALFERGLRRESEYEWSNYGHTSEDSSGKIEWTPSWSVSENHKHFLTTGQEVFNPHHNARYKNGISQIEYIPAYLLSELMEMLPKNMAVGQYGKEWCCWPDGGMFELIDGHEESGKNPIQAVVNMLLWLSDQGIIDLGEL